MNPPRHEGTLKKWNTERGFGFILAHGDDHDIFVHATAFPHDGYLPTVGEVLTFDIEPDRSGKRSAVRVQRFIDPAQQGAKNGGRLKKLRLSKSPPSSSGHSPLRRGQKVIVLMLLVALAVLVYSRYSKRVGQIGAAAHCLGLLCPNSKANVSTPATARRLRAKTGMLFCIDRDSDKAEREDQYKYEYK